MKLKPVVASLAMLGLMTPAFAKSNLVSQQAVLNQNSVVTPLCAKDWFNRIQIGGEGTVLGVVGNNSPAGYFNDTDNSSDLYIKNFNFLLNAELSSWSKVDVNLAYLGAPEAYGIQKVVSGDTIVYSLYAGSVKKHSVVLDEAYVTIGDLKQHPFYLVAGKKYLPFGDYPTYTPYQIKSPAQSLAQTNATTVIAGLSADFGLYASVFGFKGNAAPKDAKAINVRNFGAKLGYYSMLDEFNLENTSFNMSLGYLNNIWDVDMFDAENAWTSTNVNQPNDRAGAVAAHVNLAYKAFSMYGNWVSAINDMTDTRGAFIKSGTEAKPWGADVGADYAFKTLGHNSHLGAAVQWSGNGKNLSDTLKQTVFPEWRLVGEYGIELFKNTELGLAIAHGKSYEMAADNKDYNTTVGLASLSVKL